MKHFFGTYFGLIKQNLSAKKLAIVFFFELIGSFFSIVSIFLLGFVIQVMTVNNTEAHKVFASLNFDIPVWLVVAGIIILNIILLCASAASYFHSVKLCRKYTRLAYKNSLDRNISHFENSSVDDLSLKNNELDNFRSFFTTDAHLTFMSIEAILRAIRPISLIVVFLVPLVVLEIKILYFLIVLIIVSSPFLFKINRDTASSAKSVFGLERKKVYAEIISAVKELDKNLRPNLSGNERAYDEIKMERMLDNFDYWKLSSDKVTYVMTIVKSVGLQLVIIILVGSLYYYENISVPTMAILGMGLLKVQEAFLGLFSRLTVLSRLYPIAKRYRGLEQKFNLAALSVNKEGGNYSDNPLLVSGKLILISMSPNFKKSEMSLLNDQLSSYSSKYDIRSLALGKHLEFFSDQPVEEIYLERLLSDYIARDDSSNKVFISLQKQIGFNISGEGKVVDIEGSVSNVWQLMSIQSKLFIYLLVVRMSDDVQYLKCSINQIETIKLVIHEAFNDYLKPVVVFNNNIEESKQAYFDIILGSSAASSSDLNEIGF